ncbi:DUF3265 domain-containing protein [Vibrio chemaguriensis]|uniref:DUF3265 domain-containing protein n=1 Tax=Vibrio chemaguriensis TaxID=2527672 RepID=A0ABX1I375_9VIBR|nr:DUF3265 domain-containing protein [Vibrio chemaguriensis]NKJ70649.1 DUF3265 domain-containing protein [Vibrio chemaguriensis]
MRTIRITNNLSRFAAWQFWFAVSFVFKAQCGGFCIALLTT